MNCLAAWTIRVLAAAVHEYVDRTHPGPGVLAVGALGWYGYAALLNEADALDGGIDGLPWWGL